MNNYCINCIKADIEHGKTHLVVFCQQKMKKIEDISEAMTCHSYEHKPAYKTLLDILAEGENERS